ncbi:hypothetical protein BMT54_03785 [Pasteurellaceae bacterium 15-036681]|nr:hypothetical protein BMT54_03785 [Pasteurellaceae bacterium 15-036681]
MARCLNPDERLFDCPDLREIRYRVNELSEMYEFYKLDHFGIGLTGALWYHTPVAQENTFQNTKWRYGVEFEVEFQRVKEQENQEEQDLANYLAKIATSILDRRLETFQGGITKDDSLDRGWEIVLAAMSRNRIIKHIESVITDHHIQPYLRHNGNAALHITVDPFETPKQQRAFHDFWNAPTLFEDFPSLILRGENLYNKARTYIRKREGGFMKNDTLRSHYHRCNVRDNGSMEVRVFQAIYDLDILKQQLYMVHIVNFLVRKGITSYIEISYYINKKIITKKNK